MAQRIPAYIGINDWRKMGRMGHVAGGDAKSGKFGLLDQAEATNRPGVYDNSTYDGMGGEAATRSLSAFSYAGGQKKTLGNRWRSSSFDDYTAMTSAHDDVVRRLTTPGAERVNLIRAAAKMGDDLVQSARGFGNKDTEFTVVAGTTGEARVYRALIDTALKHFPASTREGAKPIQINPHHEEKAEVTLAKFKEAAVSKKGQQVLPKGEKDFAPGSMDTFLADFRKAADVPMFRDHQVMMQNGSTQTYKGKIAVFAEKGRERDAVAWMLASDNRRMLAPQPTLIGELARHPNKGHRIDKPYDADAKPAEVITSIIASADRVVVFPTGNHKSKIWQIAGEAAAAGKLAKVFGSDNKEQDILASQKAFLSNYVSKQEYARGKALEGLNVSADTGAGRVALDMVQDERRGKLSPDDMKKLSDSRMSILTIVGLAQSEEGREKLASEHKVSGKAITLLGDDQIMAEAGNRMTETLIQASQNGVTIISGDALPSGLRGANPYYFAKGPVDLLRHEKPIVGIASEPIADPDARAIAASRGSRVLAEVLKSNDVRIATIEGQMPFRHDPRQGDIVFLPSGHSVVKTAEQANERESLEDRGVITLSPFPPMGQSYYNRISKEREVAIASEDTRTTERVARILGAVSSELIVLNADATSRTSIPREAIESAAEKGTRPIIVAPTPGSTRPEFSTNMALTSKRGEPAFRVGGFGEAEAIRLGKEYEGAIPGISTGQDLEKAGRQVVLKATGSKDFAPVMLEQKRREAILSQD